MSIFYRCPECGQMHRSRLQASRHSRFNEVISQLGDILEMCPATGDWTPLTFADMSWRAEVPLANGTAR